MKIITEPADNPSPWWKKLAYGFTAGAISFTAYLIVKILHMIYVEPWCVEYMPAIAEDDGCRMSQFPAFFSLLVLFGVTALGILLYNAFTAHLRGRDA